MKMKLLLLISLLCLFCHKDIMLQQGYNEIKEFEWKIIEEQNRLKVMLRDRQPSQ